MKKYVILSVMVLAATIVAAKPLATQSSLVDSLFYDFDDNSLTAVVTVSDFWNTGHKKKLGYYPQQTIIIPASVGKEIIPLGGSPYIGDFSVVEIGVSAFAKAKATSVEFAAPSNVTTIGTLAFSQMTNMSGKLTLPASLTHLAVSAILLPNITEIEFLGDTPPTCEISGDYTPWTSATSATPKDIKITVPDGAEANYKAAAGIGDYFDCFSKETPTALDNMRKAVAPATKSLRNGMLIIERNGHRYTPLGHEVR